MIRFRLYAAHADAALEVNRLTQTAALRWKIALGIFEPFEDIQPCFTTILPALVVYLTLQTFACSIYYKVGIYYLLNSVQDGAIM